MKVTTTIKLTREEAERIATALNFYGVEYNQKKRQENPDNKFWEEEWFKTLDLECRMFKVEKRIKAKESKKQ